MWGEIDEAHCLEMQRQFEEPVHIIEQWIQRYRDAAVGDASLVQVEELEALKAKVQEVAYEATDAYWQSSSAYNC